LKIGFEIALKAMRRSIPATAAAQPGAPPPGKPSWRRARRDASWRAWSDWVPLPQLTAVSDQTQTLQITALFN